MKWRFTILYLNIVLMTFIGVNAFAGANHKVGSIVPHFENSHSQSARYHGNQSQYVEDNSPESDPDLDPAPEIQYLCFMPAATPVVPVGSEGVPHDPTATEKRFLVLCSILV